MIKDRKERERERLAIVFPGSVTEPKAVIARIGNSKKASIFFIFFLCFDPAGGILIK